MSYTYRVSEAPGADERFRERVRFTADACLRLRLPVRALPLLARITGHSSSTSLGGRLVALVRDPVNSYDGPAFVWAMNYGSANLLRRMTVALSATDPDRWQLKLVKGMNPDLLLPREYLVPDYQVFECGTTALNNVLICFAGNARRLNMPVQLFHCAVAEKFDLLIYLRDNRRKGYAEGIPGLGDDPDALTQALADWVPNGSRVAVLATSAGGIAAARVANTLQADRLLLCSPPSISRAPDSFREVSLNNVGETRIFFAANHGGDRSRAREWQDVKGAPAIEWVDTVSHGTLTELAAQGELEALIEWLTGEMPGRGEIRVAGNRAGSAVGYC